MKDFNEYPTEMQERIVNACANLVEMEMGKHKLEYGVNLVDGIPGVVAYDDCRVRIAVIRVDDARENDINVFAPITQEEIDFYNDRIRNFFNSIWMNAEDEDLSFDLIDIAIASDNRAVTRICHDATPTDEIEDISKDFENQIFNTVRECMSTGKELRTGSILNVDGEAFFAGTFETERDDVWNFPTMTVEEFVSASDWNDFNIDGEMYWSARSAIEACGELHVKKWYPYNNETSDGENDTVVKIETV